MFCSIRVSKKILEGVKKLNNEIIEKVIGDFSWNHFHERMANLTKYLIVIFLKILNDSAWNWLSGFRNIELLNPGNSQITTGKRYLLVSATGSTIDTFKECRSDTFNNNFRRIFKICSQLTFLHQEDLILDRLIVKELYEHEFSATS